jgi:hypothetical protein
MLAVPLQIYLDGVKNLAHFRERRLVHKSAAYQHGTKPTLFTGPGYIGQIFRIDRRFVVAEGNDARLSLGYGSADLHRGYIRHPIILRGGLREFPVLTKFALKGTPRCAYGICVRPRQEMIERFLLNGIYMDGDRAAVHKTPQFSVHIHACAALSPLTGSDNTAVGA